MGLGSVSWRRAVLCTLTVSIVALCCALCWVWVWVCGRAWESRMYDGISDRKRSCPAVSHLVGVEFEPMSC